MIRHTIFLLLCISCRDINDIHGGLTQRDHVLMMNAVANFYSKPQVGGAIKTGSRRADTYRKFGIPMYRNGAGVSAEGVEEAVKAAGGKVIKKFVRESPNNEEKRILHSGAPELRTRFADSKDGMTSKTMAIPKKKKKKTKKHKRSKIDDVLGDDSY